jgi:hypothetical protein
MNNYKGLFRPSMQKPKKPLTAKEHKKDELDKKCDRIFDVLSNEQTVDDKIGLLEQCLDYLRMEKAQIEEEHQNENAD